MVIQQIWTISMHNRELHTCRVCGRFYPDFLPWGDTGKDPSHEICDCCGTEFGYEDCTIDGVKNQRKVWIDSGMKWFDPAQRPPLWDFEEQLKNIPYLYE